MFQQIRHLCTVWCRLIKRQAFCLLIRQWQVETISVFDQVLFIKFFLAMRSHLALTGTAHAKTLFGVRQDNYRLSFVCKCSSIGGIDLHYIVATAF